MNEPERRDRLIALERQFWSSGSSFYETHLADDCVMVFPGGGVLSRDAAIAGLAGAPRWRDVQMDDVRVLTPAQDIAVLVYAAAARREDHEPVYRVIASSTYVRRSGEWRLAFHQQTPAG